MTKIAKTQAYKECLSRMQNAYRYIKLVSPFDDDLEKLVNVPDTPRGNWNSEYKYWLYCKTLIENQIGNPEFMIDEFYLYIQSPEGFSKVHSQQNDPLVTIWD